MQEPKPSREIDVDVVPTVVGANIGPLSPTPNLPANQPIKVAFDRLLHPLYVTRQSFQVQEAGGVLVQPLPSVTYDPVSRVVTIGGNGTWLTPKLFYKLVMPAAGDAADVFGPRAFDGVPLRPDDPNRVISFMAIDPVSPAPPSSPSIDFCTDIFGSIFRGQTLGGPKFEPIGFRCTDANCHGAYREGSVPAMNLILETESGIANTAIGRAARTGNQGAIAGPGSPSKRAFPSDMPIIDPFNPGNSYLLYKVLLAQLPPPGPDGGLTTSTSCDNLPTLVGLPYAPGSSLGGDERARLSDWMVGGQMPRSDPAYALTMDELERLSLWIAQGAPITTCTTRCKY